MPITNEKRWRYHSAVAANAPSLLRLANVVAVGVGSQHRRGIDQDMPAVVVGVTRKIPTRLLRKRSLVPKVVMVGGQPYRTDVVEVGHIQAQHGANFDPQKRHRPVCPGISIGHTAVTAGTLGLLVVDAVTHEVLLLSNNHILANSNDAQPGDAIVQPGTYDGGSLPDDQVGRLARFIPINWDGGAGGPPTCPWVKLLIRGVNWIARHCGRKHRLAAYVPASVEPNRVDAAVCALQVDGIPDIPGIGVVREYIPADELTIGLPVQKYGRTTRHTRASVIILDAVVRVSYGAGRTATFRDQIITGAMSAGGDSGSSVHTTEEPPRMAGLLYAGSEQTTVLCPADAVFALLGVNLIPG